MIQKIFAVRDSKTEAFLQPFFMPARGAAIRGFTDAVNDPSHGMGKHPEDYTLFEIGSFDDESGALVSHPSPQSIGSGFEFLRSQS